MSARSSNEWRSAIVRHNAFYICYLRFSENMAGIRVADRKLLWGRSGDECAFPSCPERLTMVPADEGGKPTSSGPVVIGEEAHIVAEEDDGPRGDPSMPVSERNAYPNRVPCPETAI